MVVVDGRAVEALVVAADSAALVADHPVAVAQAEAGEKEQAWRSVKRNRRTSTTW